VELIAEAMKYVRAAIETLIIVVREGFTGMFQLMQTHAIEAMKTWDAIPDKIKAKIKEIWGENIKDDPIDEVMNMLRAEAMRGAQAPVPVPMPRGQLFGPMPIP
jgi:hypothetical protein